jgi:hypothetical protein
LGEGRAKASWSVMENGDDVCPKMGMVRAAGCESAGVPFSVGIDMGHDVGQDVEGRIGRLG